MTQDRRRRIRVAVNGEVLGRIHTVAGAPLLDISETGALLQVSCPLRPGTLYGLRLPLGSDEHASFKSRVVRSYVHGFESRAGGETAVTYRVAVEFVGVSEEQRRILREHLARWEQELVRGHLEGGESE